MAIGYIPDATGLLIPGFVYARIRGQIDWSQSTDNNQSTITVYGVAQEIYSFDFKVNIGVAVDMPVGATLDVKYGDGSINYNPGNVWTNVAQTDLAKAIITRTTENQTAYIRAYIWIQDKCYAGWNTMAVLTIPARVDKPLATGTPKATRVNDNRIDLSWTRNATAYGIYSATIVERAVDSETNYTVNATLSGTASAYSDTTTQSNHSYKYRIRVTNSAGSATSIASETIFNTPEMPSNLYASRLNTSTVMIEFDNNALTATSFNRQRSQDKKNWSNIGALQSGTATSTTDTPGGGEWYYRFQAARSSPILLVSEWSDPSNVVVTITPPSEPTLTAPASGAVISKAESTVTFSWVHNPIDGSAQTAAQLRISTNNGSSYTTTTYSGAAQQATRAIDWAVNTTVTWSVRTRGADVSYGPWSSDRTFIVRQVPQAVITSPASDGVVIDTMPLLLAWSYTDQSGNQQQARLSINDSSGSSVWQRVINGTTTSYMLNASEFLLANNESFDFVLEVVSTTSLSSSTSRSFTADYVEPVEPEMIISQDERMASIQTILLFGQPDGVKPSAVSLGLFRRHPDGSVQSLGMGYPNGTAVVDHFVPTDMLVEYIAVAASSAGVTSQTVSSVYLKSYGAAVFNYGPDYRRVAKLAVDVKQSSSREHDRTLFHTAGAVEPLVFYGKGVTNKGSRSGSVLSGQGVWPKEDDPSSFEDIDALSRHTGDVVMRLPAGRAFMADISVSTDTSQPLVSVSIDWQEVRSHDGLAL